MDNPTAESIVEAITLLAENVENDNWDLVPEGILDNLAYALADALVYLAILNVVSP